MKKIVIALTLSAVALSSAYAAPNAGTLSPEKAAAKKVTCNVQTLADAEKCMEKVARARPSYENANEGFASKDVSKLADVLKVLSRKDEDVQQAVGSDFAGVMLEYGDEFHIYYFAIKKGQNVKPVELYDLNTVDFEFLLTTPYSPEALDPDTYFLGLDLGDNGVYRDVGERLSELKDSQQ